MHVPRWGGAPAAGVGGGGGTGGFSFAGVSAGSLMVGGDGEPSTSDMT